MIVIPPLDFNADSSMLVSSSVVEGESPDPSGFWTGGAYTLGDRVRTPTTTTSFGKIYECLETLTGGSSPPISAASTVPKWVEVSPVNKWSMFDTLRDTETVAESGNITVVIKPNTRINSLVFLNMTNITTISVVGIDRNGFTVYSPSLIFNPGINYVLTDIPLIRSMQLTIVLNGTCTIAIGSLVVGKYEYLGEVQRGLEVNSLNFSSVTRDIYGNANLVARRSVPKLDKTLFVEAQYITNIVKVRDALNATPAVWIGMNNREIAEYYDPLFILGFYKSFSITLDSHIGATISLELEEI